MAALLKKHWIVSTFKKAGVSLKESFVERKKVCHLELADIYLQVVKSIYFISPNCNLFKSLMVGG